MYYKVINFMSNGTYLTCKLVTVVARERNAQGASKKVWSNQKNRNKIETLFEAAQESD